MFFQFVLQIPQRFAGPIPGRVFVTLLCFLLVMIRPWSRVSERVRDSQKCTMRWKDVPYLAGAKLSPSAEGIHRLVKSVRKNSDEYDTVLLLPNDPNVEA